MPLIATAGNAHVKRPGGRGAIWHIFQRNAGIRRFQDLSISTESVKKEFSSTSALPVRAEGEKAGRGEIVHIYAQGGPAEMAVFSLFSRYSAHNRGTELHRSVNI